MLAVILVGTLLLALALSSASHRRGRRLLHWGLNGLALLLAVLPLGLTLWVGYRHFLLGRSWGSVPLSLGLLLGVGVVCAGASLLLLVAGEWVSGFGTAGQGQRRRAEIREKVEGGRLDLACHVVATDPDATPEDMRRCRTRIESLTDPKARWAAFQLFLERHFELKTWHPQEVGLSRYWDLNEGLVVVRHDQEWFLRTFYETWLAQPEAFQSLEDLERLQACLRRTTRSFGWTLAALEGLRTQILPELLQRLETRPGRSRPDKEALRDASRKRIATLLETPEAGGGPPVPSLPDAPAPDAIGVARMGDDDTLHLWMRATATHGQFGDVYFCFARELAEYNGWMTVLGPMRRGQVRGVPPFKLP
ncbi:hypothetical protein D7V88_05900 [Corallococcus terminator]|uniref:Uncharacterized protein n=2 Tax=Corallococcus terminator TaxID=2316733 RepID=A0A3A8JSB6_9BACT|nr:hypothetical protein D7V88_05900 [Corallococcus terminator]